MSIFLSFGFLIHALLQKHADQKAKMCYVTSYDVTSRAKGGGVYNPLHHSTAVNASCGNPSGTALSLLHGSPHADEFKIWILSSRLRF